MKTTLCKDRIKETAKGREIEILKNVAGIPEELLNNKKEHPCPKCNGNTRFRLINAEAGAVRCNWCFEEKCGDFIAAVQWMRECNFAEALLLIDEYLEKTPKPEALKTITKTTTQKKRLWKFDETPDHNAITDWCRKHKKGTGLGGVLRCRGTTGWYDSSDREEPSLYLPMFDADLEKITGGVTYLLDGTEIDGKKVINIPGSKSGIIGTVDVLQKLFDEHGKDGNTHQIRTVYKVEGPTDAIAIAEAIPELERQSVAVFANACGANENPDKTPYKELIEAIAAAGCDLVLVGDNDDPGQSGVAKWGMYAAQKGCNTWTVQLPEKIGDTEINDLRDYFLAGGCFANLDKTARPFETNDASDNSTGHTVKKKELHSALDWEPFPVNTFPKSLQNYIVESAAALNIDPAYVGPSVLAVTASVIGSAWGVELKNSWSEPAIVWLATVAVSGSGKSPGLDAAIEPIRAIQKDADKRYKEVQMKFEKEQTLYNQSLTLWKAAQKKDLSQELPEKPIEPIIETYIVDDTTPEALVEILEQNPFGVCLPKDELSGWIGGFDAYSSKKAEKDLAFWLAVHGGRSYRSNRKTEKKLAIASTPAVSICGGIQPGILRKILTKNEHFFEAGLAARILFAMPPDRSQHWTDDDVDDTTRLQYQNIIKKIIGLRSGKDPLNPEEPCIVKLSKSASKLFIEFYNANADERAAMASETQKAFWPKLTGYAARIALVFHIAKWVEGSTTERLVLDGTTMEEAIRLTQWFKRESLRIVETVRGEAAQVDLEAAGVIEAIKRKGGEITVRELQRCHSRYMEHDGAKRAEEKLRELVSKGKLKTTWVQGERGPGKEIFIITEDTDIDRFPRSTGKNHKPVNVNELSCSKTDFSQPVSSKEPQPLATTIQAGSPKENVFEI